MKYCFTAMNYPTPERQVHVFLENVVLRLVDLGEECHVVAPQSYITYFFKKKNRRELIEERTTKNGNRYMVYSPLYFVFPKRKIGSFSFHEVERNCFYKALKRTYVKHIKNADLIYSHFIQPGIAGTRLATELNIPSFIANGEADTADSLKLMKKETVERTLRNVTGIISVSTKNKNEIAMLSDNNPEVMKKVKIIVNAVDSQRFVVGDKKKLRSELGWPEDKFVVSFTGSFIERKGINRLSEALKRFDDVYSTFMGVGPIEPDCPNILHSGRVNNSVLPKYLNASDVFVLPTEAEGCSNAIVEAIACGIPVISSDLEFNYDILDDSCAVLIDPDDVDAIENAIRTLKDNPDMLQRLADGAKEKACSLSLDVRVDKIRNFINEMK